MALRTILSTHYLCGWALLLLRLHSGLFLASSTWDSGLRLNKARSLRLTGNNPDTFSIWRATKQVMVGECRIKNIYCMLGALQRPFREPAFVPKGGDALRVLRVACTLKLERIEFCCCRTLKSAWKGFELVKWLVCLYGPRYDPNSQHISLGML